MPVASASVITNDFYSCLVDNLDDAVFFVDGEGNVVYWNRSAEKLTGRIAEDIVGRSCSQTGLLHISSAGMCDGPEASPAALVLKSGRRHEADVFFRHLQGHLVPAHVCVVPFRNSRGQLAGVVEIMSDNSTKIASDAKMDALRGNSLLDPLTETASRKHLEIRMQAKLEESKRYGWPFGLVAAGIDNFDVIKEAHSRETTDRLIQMAAKTFANTLRTYDVIGRWEEARFLAVVAIKSPEDLKIIGERIRALVEKSYVAAGSRVLGVTLSIGATSANETDTVESLAERAQQSVDQSLQAGGNRVL